MLKTNILSKGLIPKNEDCKSQSLCVQMQSWLCAVLRQSPSSWGNYLVLKQTKAVKYKYKPQCIFSDLLCSPFCKVLLSVSKITFFSPVKHETFLISVSFFSRKRKHVLLLKMLIRNCFLSQKKIPSVFHLPHILELFSKLHHATVEVNQKNRKLAEK